MKPELSSSRTFVKKGRNSTAAIVDQIRGEGTDTSAAENLWSLVDKNKDGVLSKGEFAQAVAVIRKQVADDIQRTAEVEEREQKATRRARFFCCISAILGLIVLVLLAANTALTYWLIDITKEVKTTPVPVTVLSEAGPAPKTSKGTTRLTAPDGRAVATSRAGETFMLGELPMLASRSAYSKIEYLHFPLNMYEDGSLVQVETGFRVESWIWYNTSAMDWMLSEGGVLNIRNGTSRFSLPDTNATAYDDDGAASRRARALSLGRRALRGDDTPGLDVCTPKMCASMDGCDSSQVGRRLEEMRRGGEQLEHKLHLNGRPLPKEIAKAFARESPEAWPQMIQDAVEGRRLDWLDFFDRFSNPCSDFLVPYLTPLFVEGEEVEEEVERKYPEIECEACKYILDSARDALDGAANDAICDALADGGDAAGDAACAEGGPLALICGWVGAAMAKWLCGLALACAEDFIEDLLCSTCDAGCTCQKLGFCSAEDSGCGEPPGGSIEPPPAGDIWEGIKDCLSHCHSDDCALQCSMDIDGMGIGASGVCGRLGYDVREEFQGGRRLSFVGSLYRDGVLRY
jgi:hypothetical protein